MVSVQQYPGFGHAWDNGGLPAASDIAEDEGNVPAHLNPLSRWMAKFLRHEAQIADDGWLKLSDLMAHPYMQRHTLNDVHLVVQESFSGTRRRFEIKDTYIRATHKHSFSRRSGEDYRPPRQPVRPPQQWQQQQQQQPTPPPAAPKPQMRAPSANSGPPPPAQPKPQMSASSASSALAPKPPPRILAGPKAADPLAVNDPWAASLQKPKPRSMLASQAAAGLPPKAAPPPSPPPGKSSVGGAKTSGGATRLTAGLPTNGTSCSRSTGQPPAAEPNGTPQSAAMAAAAGHPAAAKAKPAPPDLMLPENPGAIPKSASQQAEEVKRLPECFTMTDTPRGDSEHGEIGTPWTSPYKQGLDETLAKGRGTELKAAAPGAFNGYTNGKDPRAGMSPEAPAAWAGAPLAAPEAAAAGQQERIEPVHGASVPEEDRTAAAAAAAAGAVAGAAAHGASTPVAEEASPADDVAGELPSSHEPGSYGESSLGRQWQRYAMPEGGYWWCAEGPGGEIVAWFVEPPRDEARDASKDQWQLFKDPDHDKVYWWSEAEWFYVN